MTPALFEIEGPKMKWFRVDSDTPADPKIARLLHDGFTETQGATKAHAAFGAMFLLCCFVADHGHGLPGEAVDPHGQPLDLGDMAFAAKFDTIEGLESCLNILAERRLIDSARWASERVVAFPAMRKRADEYTQRMLKTKGSGPVATSSGHPREGSGHVGSGSGVASRSSGELEKGSPTRQDKTVHNKVPVGELIDLWNALHLKHVGTKAAMTRPKDPAALARLAKDRQGETPDAKALIVAFFESTDPFIRRAGYSVGVMVSQTSKLIAALRLKPGSSARPVARRAGAGAAKDKYSKLRGDE